MKPLNYRILDINFRIPNTKPEPFQMQENPFQDRGNRGKRGYNVEIIRNGPFQNKERTFLKRFRKKC